MFILHNSLSFQLWIKFFFCIALRASDFASALESIPFPRATVPWQIVVFVISLPQLYHYHRGPVVHYIWPLLLLKSFIPLHVKKLLRTSLTAAFFWLLPCHWSGWYFSNYVTVWLFCTQLFSVHAENTSPFVEPRSKKKEGSEGQSEIQNSSSLTRLRFRLFNRGHRISLILPMC